MENEFNEQHCHHENSFMEGQYIQNVAQLRSYILGQLGSPVICVEISQEQLNAIIADCVKYIWRYYSDEGNYRDYMVMELVPGKSHYHLCEELESVVDFQTSNWLGGINELFTVPHNMLYDQVMTAGNCWQGNCWGNSASYGDLMGNWTASLTWLKDVKNTFGESYQVRYNTKDHELMVMPTPKRPIRGLMEVYKRQKVEHVFNDFWFKELCIARAGMTWANALRKYSLTLARAAGTLNSDALYSSYKERWDAAVERIDKESPVGHCILTG